MGSISSTGVDAWLRAGGMVVAASDRAARAVRTAFHRARRAEGRRAWPAPQVLDWTTFARTEWENRVRDGRLTLNAPQEQSLWYRIVSESEHTEGWLEGPRRRLADLAMEAHELLCLYAPRLLRAGARIGWQQDAGAFSGWLASFDDTCAADSLLSAGRVPLEIEAFLEEDGAARPPLLLAGFDRLLPMQQRVFDAWGEWSSIALAEPAAEVRWYEAANEQLELDACALWCRRRLDADPQARLLVIAQDANQRRGEMERAFLRHVGAAETPRFEFSLGIPLGQVALARAAVLLLRWLHGAIKEHELDWLLASGAAVASEDETAALQTYMRRLRRRGLQRTEWTLSAFLRQNVASAQAQITWVERMTSAQQRLKKAAAHPQSPLDWAALTPQLLRTIGWPGPRRLTSAEFQVTNRWQQAVDVSGSLGFDGRRIPWIEFLSDLERTLKQTLFAEESQDAPILIAGPAESAGLAADAVWFLGADEDAWPAGGATHPLLPIDVQRDHRMPHGWPQFDWELGETITRRVLGSGRQVCFSYARQKDDVDTRPSRLVGQFAGEPRPIPAEFVPPSGRKPLTIAVEDRSSVPLRCSPAGGEAAQLSLFGQPDAVPARQVTGGSTVLTSQSQCPFKAFAIARLEAQRWDRAQAGLTAAQRGQLLHAVLHSVWGGPPGGIRTFQQLQALGADLGSFVEAHVERVLADEMPETAREQMPARYLELEQERLTRLVTEWLEYERARVPFTVDATEVDSETTIASLTLKLRLDRVDRLNDGSLLVVDYKSGNVSQKSWELPRPDDVQLPLYAEFALSREEALGGLVFAKVRPGEVCFAGRVVNASATLNPALNGTSSLVKNPLTPQQRSDWKREIERLARDFVAGRAEVDPREYPDTCERCGLFTLCRVREREDALEGEDEGMEGSDE